MRTTFRRDLSEEDAAAITRSGSPWARFWLGMTAGVRLALDTRDTQQVFLLAQAVDGERLELTCRRLRATPAGRKLLAERPSIDSTGVDYGALRALPARTLGGAYARALQRQGLDPDVFQAPPGLPDELAYTAKRIRQSHDLWHVLTGLDTDIPGEIALQAFTEAQIQSKTAALIVRFGQLIFGRRYPALRGLVKRYRALGERAVYLLEVPWEEYWERDLDDVRRELLQAAVA
ncbi:MAG TPA: Coq4 family protein [Polyangiales bacterium]